MGAIAATTNAFAEVLNHFEIRDAGEALEKRNWDQFKKKSWKVVQNYATHAAMVAVPNILVPGAWPFILGGSVGADLVYSGYRGLRKVSRNLDEYSKDKGKNWFLRKGAGVASFGTGAAAGLVGLPFGASFSALKGLGDIWQGNNKFITDLAKKSDGSEAGNIGKAAFGLVGLFDGIGKRMNPPETPQMAEARKKTEEGGKK